jgi:enoyl-CoA hydratase/carnithine racemase
MALRLSRAPTKAIGQMKYELRKNIDQDLTRALELELELMEEPADDRQEGRLSFVEGRDPVFKGT